MKKYLSLFILLSFCSNLLAQEKKMDELVYDFLSKYDIKEYPDSALVVVRSVCFNDTCAFGFYIDENFTDLERSIEVNTLSVQPQLYIYNLSNGKKILIKFIQRKGNRWKSYFHHNQLTKINPDDVKKHYKEFYTYYNISDKYLRQHNETMFIVLGDKAFWELAPKWITISEVEKK